MKLFLVILLVSGLRPWFQHAIPSAVADEAAGNTQAVTVQANVSSLKSPCVIVRSGSAPCVKVRSAPAVNGVTVGNTGAFAYAVAVGDPADDGRSERAVVWVSNDEVEPKDEHAWLGISIGEVPAALTDQLDLEGRGILVENVFEDSPADRAGIQIHDVILTVGDDQVRGGPGGATDLIGSYQPGDTVDVLVLRKGRKETLRVTLGSRSDVKETFKKLKLRRIPDAEIEERIRTRGKILRKGEDDQWIVENLEDLEELEGLPKGVLKFVPEEGKISTQILVQNDEKKIKTKVERDGSTIVITQKSDGPITVTRVGKDGEETEATYRSEKELREADEEAYAIWKKASHSVVINLDVDGIEMPEVDIPELEFSFDVDKWKEHAEQWQEQMEKWGEQWEEHAEQWQEQMEEWGDQWKEQMEAWKESHGLPDDMKLPPLPMFRNRDGHSELPPLRMLRQLGKPKHSFEVQSDGTIEVKIRKGDSQLIQRYENEDDLARRAPELYEKYLDLMGADQE